MANKPELIKVNETMYKCSCGEWKWELNTARPNIPNAAVWQALLEQRFAEHVKQSHT